MTIKILHLLSNWKRTERSGPAVDLALAERALGTEFNRDVVHCHMWNAYLLGSMARARSKPPFMVRSCYDPDGPKSDLRSRFLYRRCMDGVIVISGAAKDKAMKRYGFPFDAIQVAESEIDLGRFSRDRRISDSTEDFGFNEEHFVIGLVSRMRESRRNDIALEL